MNLNDMKKHKKQSGQSVGSDLKTSVAQICLSPSSPVQSPALPRFALTSPLVPFPAPTDGTVDFTIITTPFVITRAPAVVPSEFPLPRK